MRLLFKLINDELGRVDLNIAECLEACYVHNIEHQDMYCILIKTEM